MILTAVGDKRGGVGASVTGMGDSDMERLRNAIQVCGFDMPSYSHRNVHCL
jgi:hypothetical protein